MTSMSRYTSYGICTLCGKHTTKAGMSRHLGSCLAEHEPSQGKVARLIRLRSEDAYSPICWMDVEMKATATVEELDDLLRGEWLGHCCHPAALTIARTPSTPSHTNGPRKLSTLPAPYA